VQFRIPDQISLEVLLPFYTVNIWLALLPRWWGTHTFFVFYKPAYFTFNLWGDFLSIWTQRNKGYIEKDACYTNWKLYIEASFGLHFKNNPAPAGREE